MFLLFYFMILGTFTLRIIALKEPLKVQDVKQRYVYYLAEMLTSDDNEMMASPYR